jgi:hypothetical protein
MTVDDLRELERIAAQLRHAFMQLQDSPNANTSGIAKGIISPAVVRLENLVASYQSHRPDLL